jgi:hypothetical protein
MAWLIKWLKILFSEPTPAVTSVENAAITENLQPIELKSAYSSDKPIERVAEDRFNRWPFAKRIAETLAMRTDPSSVVVGVYAPWGDGKTSVLRLMEIALESHEDIIPVRFNPWYFRSQEKLTEGFFRTLAQKAGKSLTHKSEELGEALKKYGSLLSLASVSVAGGIVQVGAADTVTGLGNALSTVELDQLKERLEKILEESKKRIVVMIDDIDRLDQDEIHAIFKLVKLSAGFNHISYVLALDDEMVAGALGKRYGDGRSQAGRSFLEKIVQVPLHVPAADEIELRKLTLEGVDAALKLSDIELSQEQADTFVRHFVDGLEERLLTPRQGKLYANALAFALPILKGEVHTVDHMLIEGIRLFYPKLYNIIRDNPRFFLEEDRSGRRSDTDKKRINALIDEALKETGVADPERIKDRLIKSLFPRAIGNVSYGSDWDKIWAKEQRIASSEYFKRYFQYSVPSGDVPDIAAETFLKEIGGKSDAEVDEILKSFSSRNGVASFIKKLRVKETEIDPEIAPRLALAFARSGALVPRERQLFSDWSFSQAAILIAQLVRRLPEEASREDLAREIIKKSEPLPFAFEALRWFRKSKDENNSERIVSESVEKELGELLASRIKQTAAEAPLYKTYGKDAPRLFWTWNEYGNHEEVEIYLKEKFNNNPEEIYDFLDTYVGTSWGMENGLPSRSEFERENYNAVARLISPGVLMEKIKMKFGKEIDHPQFHQPKDAAISRQLAHQFTVCHQKALSEKVPPTPLKNRPRLDLEDLMVSGGADGNHAIFKIINTGDKPAVDISFSFEAEHIENEPTLVHHLLSPSEKTSAVDYRYDPTPFFTQKLERPRIILRYKDQEGNELSSGRFLQQDSRADGNYNIHNKLLGYFEN